MDRPIWKRKIFTGTSIAASGSLESAAIDLRGIANAGIFSVYNEMTGDGTGKLEYLLSVDGGVTYLEPSGASDIASGITKTSGSGADGKDIYGFQPELATHMKLKWTETGGAQAITPNTWLVIQ